MPTLSGKRARPVRQVLLAHRGDRAQPPRLADVGVLGEAVGRVADDVAAQPQAGEARLGLHPVEEAQAQLARARRPPVEHHLVGVVDLGPVHERDVGAVGAGREQPARRDATEAPQVLVEVGVVEVRADRQRVLVRVRCEPALDGAVRLRIGRDPAEARRELVVARGPRDRVVLPREMVDGEADRDRLEVARLVLRGRVRLAGHRLRLEAGHALGGGERQEVAALRRVEEPVGHHHRVLAAPAQRHRGDAVAVGLGRHRRVLEPQVDAARQHRLEHGERDARLVPEPGDEAGARIEVRETAGGVGERGVLAVVGADAVAQRAVARGAAVRLDPGVLVGRHRLAGELPADPVGRLAQHDVEPAAGRGDRRRDPAEAAAGDQDVRAPLDQSRALRARPPLP